MGKLTKVTIAYLIATFAAIVTGWVGAIILREWSNEPVTIWLFIAVIWMVIVGLPSLLAAANYLLKLLGVKKLPWVDISNSRSVPVGVAGNIAYTSPKTIPALQANGQQQIQLDEIEIRAGDYVINYPVLMGFLRQAWYRQRNHQDGLSRNWWVSISKKLERSEYEAIISVLVSYGLIQGRTQGRSGKLIMPPLATIEILIQEA